MTKLVFETATLADAVKKASLVAPSKGAAFDKAAGVVFDINPAEAEPVMLRATNLALFYTAIVDVVEAEGEAVLWRLPAQVLAAMIGSLPIGSGKVVTLEQKANKVVITQGRTKATLNLISAEYFPTWDLFDPDELETIQTLGARIGQVQWACAKADPQPLLNGIHMDGKNLYATDKYRIAIAECEIPLNSPVTIDASVLTSVLRQMGDTKIGSDGDMLLLMPDEHTQIKAVILGDSYVNLQGIITRVGQLPDQHTVKVKKPQFIEMIKRASVMQGSDRYPTLRLYIGAEEIAAVMSEQDVGLLGDVLELPGQCTHDRVEIKFLPKNLTDALEASPNDDIELTYSLDVAKCVLVVDGGSGYKAWVSPRRDRDKV